MVGLFKTHVPPRRGRYTNTLTKDGKVTTTRQLGNIEEQCHLVCAKCNNGWKSDIESAAQPILTMLIERGMSAEPLTITAEEQYKIAIWLQLRSIIFDALNEASHYSLS